MIDIIMKTNYTVKSMEILRRCRYIYIYINGIAISAVITTVIRGTNYCSTGPTFWFCVLP